MSKFNNYARRVNEIAQTAFTEYTAAESKLKAAEAQSRKYPQHHGAVDYEYAARSARAQADLMEAREALHKAQMHLNDRIRDIAAIRQELAEALDAEYSADPSALDSNTLELLKSGILRGSEYAKLLHDAQEAGNITMSRMVSHYASNAAEEAARKYGDSDPRAVELRAVAYQSSADTDAVSAKLNMFDVLVEAFTRTANNTAMIRSWDELTADIVESF